MRNIYQYKITWRHGNKSNSKIYSDYGEVAKARAYLTKNGIKDIDIAVILPKPAENTENSPKSANSRQ